MKIYTVKKKPKLYGLLIFSALCAAAVCALYLLKDKIGRFAAGNLAVFLAFYFLAALAFLATALIKQLKYNPYSYNTIYYFGFALFDLSLLVPQTALAVRTVAHAGVFGLSDLFSVTLSSAQSFMKITLPFIILFSAALAASNVWLMKREGPRVQNVLGIALAVCLLGGEALVFFFGKEEGALGFFIGLFSFLYIYVECMIIGAVFADVFAARHTPARDKDYILILGCRVRGDGEPTPLLRSRADAALSFAKRQFDETGKKAKFIPSGGRGNDEPVSEAECVKNYLIARGVAKEDVILEDASRDTAENMRLSFALTEKEDRCAFATTNYHVFRSGIAANRAEKFKAEGIGAPTKWYFWPNASVREFAGLLTGHVGKQALIVAGLVALYLVSYFASRCA